MKHLIFYAALAAATYVLVQLPGITHFASITHSYIN